MPRLARLTLFTLLAAGAAPATNPAEAPTTSALIDQLADPDASVRKQAFEALQRRAAEAGPALRTAREDPRPAVADAAGELLLNRKWYTAADSPDVVKVLNRADYGRQPPERRAGVLQQLLALRLRGASKTVIRILSQDPSPAVAWNVFEPIGSDDDAYGDFVLDAEGLAETLKLDAAARPAGLKAWAARTLARRGDPAALPLIHDALRQERDESAATPNQLAAAVRVLADAECRSGDPAFAATTIRELLAGPVAASDRITLTDRLLALHATRGPLPGIGGDLRIADKDPETHAAFALAEMARRNGMPVAAATLQAVALRGGDGENEIDRAARLTDSSVFLRSAGASELACRALDAVTQVETPATRGRVTMAYVRLSELHDYAGRYAHAGDALQRALSRQEGPLSITRDGEPEIWPLEDEQARVYWYYLLDAAGRGDRAAVEKQAANILASGSTDGDLFLNVQPYLKASPEQIDAYFERAYTYAKSRIEQSPERPRLKNELAWLCARFDRHLPEALLAAEAAVNGVPNEPAYLDTLAEVKFRLGRAKEAVELEQRALAQSPDEEVFMTKQLERFKKAATTQP